MAYAMCRLYAGSSQTSAEEIVRIGEQELIPQIRDAGGLIRYSFIQTTDGRIGSFSAFETQQAAEQAQRLAADWVKDTSVLQGYKLAETWQGELGQTIQGQGDQLHKGAYGIARIYETDASVQDVQTAFDQAKIKAIPGLLRLTFVQLQGGGVGAFSAFENKEAALQLTELARNERNQSGSKAQKVLPKDPEQFDVTILDTYTS